MRLGLIVLVLLVAISEARRKVFTPGQLYPRFDLYKECPYNKFENFGLENITITKYGAHDYFLNGFFHVYRELDMIKMIIKIKRCPNTAESSCEYWQTWTFGRDSCAVLMQKDVPWEGFFYRTVPEIHCPTKKGTYEHQNATLILKHLAHLPIPLENNYWRVTVESYDKNGFFCCFQLAAAVIRSRN